MRNIEQKIVDKFTYFDTSSKQNSILSFISLWHTQIAFEKHLNKRIKEGVVKDAYDYLCKTIDSLANAQYFIIAKYEKSWDRICYVSGDDWFVIFSENGIMLTSYKKDETKLPFERKHRQLDARLEKGIVDEKFRRVFKSIQTKLGKLRS